MLKLKVTILVLHKHCSLIIVEFLCRDDRKSVSLQVLASNVSGFSQLFDRAKRMQPVSRGCIVDLANGHFSQT